MGPDYSRCVMNNSGWFNDLADCQRRVDAAGKLYFRNHIFRAGKAVRGYDVAFGPAIQDSCFDVFFADHLVATIDLNDAS